MCRVCWENISSGWKCQLDINIGTETVNTVIYSEINPIFFLAPYSILSNKSPFLGASGYDDVTGWELSEGQTSITTSDKDPVLCYKMTGYLWTYFQKSEGDDNNSYPANHDYWRFQPLKSSRCIKASFYIAGNRLNFPTTKGFKIQMSMKLVYQYRVPDTQSPTRHWPFVFAVG